MFPKEQCSKSSERIQGSSITLPSVSLVNKVFASLTNVGSLAVGAFDLVNCSMSVLGFCFTDFGQ